MVVASLTMKVVHFHPLTLYRRRQTRSFPLGQSIPDHRQTQVQFLFSVSFQQEIENNLQDNGATQII
jgi:hypothetical protein